MEKESKEIKAWVHVDVNLLLQLVCGQHTATIEAKATIGHASEEEMKGSCSSGQSPDQI